MLIKEESLYSLSETLQSPLGDIKGLNDNEVIQSREKNGTNELSPKKKEQLIIFFS